MQTKQAILENIHQRITELQAAYKTISGLPEDVFSPNTVNNVANVVLERSSNTPLSRQPKNESTEVEYGGYKAYVLEIIKQHKGISRSRISELFYAKFPTANETTVGTALINLQKNNQIRKEKPKGVKIKGYYWYANNINDDLWE